VIVSDSRAHDFHAAPVARLDGAGWLPDNQLPEVAPLASEPQHTAICALNEQGWSLQSLPAIQVAAKVTIAAAPLTPDAAAPMRLAAANGRARPGVLRLRAVEVGGPAPCAKRVPIPGPGNDFPV